MLVMTSCTIQNDPFLESEASVTIRQTFEQGKLYEGHVVVQAVSNREIGVALDGTKIAGSLIPDIDGDSSSLDGVFDWIFDFETNDSVPTDLFYNLEKAQLLVFKDGGLLIASSEEPLVLGFRVSDNIDRSELLALIAWNGNRASERVERFFSGFKLARYSGAAWGTPDFKVKSAKADYTTIFHALGADELFDTLMDHAELFGKTVEVCTSGGPNSKSASIGGCTSAPTSASVSCNQTFYACCFCTFPVGHAECECRPSNPE
jgi:hypothetical protein